MCASAITRKCYITEFISYYTWYFDMWVFVITEYEVENEFWKPAVSGPAKAISESYWSATLSITADLLWWNRAAEIISHYLNPAFKHNVQRSNYFTSKKIQMRQLAFVQHMQWMSHRCWSADMVKVPGTGCISGKHDECDPFLQQRHKATTSTWHQPRTDWLVSTVAHISLCHHLAYRANTGPLTLLFLPHSIKMQSVWLIVVSYALRQDHHFSDHLLDAELQLLWRSLKCPFFPDVYTRCRNGPAEGFKTGQIITFGVVCIVVMN